MSTRKGGTTRFSNIAKFYTWSCLSGINLLYTVQAIYLFGKGFTAPQLALFASMTVICTTLFELPTRYIRDYHDLLIDSPGMQPKAKVV